VVVVDPVVTTTAQSAEAVTVHVFLIDGVHLIWLGISGIVHWPGMVLYSGLGQPSTSTRLVVGTGSVLGLVRTHFSNTAQLQTITLKQWLSY
jgi:hypothetical protein